MNSDENKLLADRSKALYASKLQTDLEKRFPDKFVAVEPDSGDWFVADSFSESVRQARLAHPNRVSFVIRIGHKAALHIGVLTN
jgi:hypothetical protein